MPAAWPPSHALFCLVTDRRTLAASLGPGIDPRRALQEQVAAAVDAGVDLVHVRERDLDAAVLRDLVGECVALARGSGTRVVVNDRLDVAMAAGADGVHLRGDSFVASRVRPAVRPGFLVGRSVRRALDVPSLAGCDYAVLGTIFPTPSKAGDTTVVGVQELARAVRQAGVPVLAIGGITEGRLAEVARAGAAGVAAIRLFLRPEAGWRALRDRVSRWRQLFDTNRAIS